MLKNVSLTYKLAIAPALALAGLIAYVVYSSLQLSIIDSRLDSLERNNYPTLETADAILFQFSRLPGIYNNAVTAGELSALEEAGQIIGDIESHRSRIATLVAGELSLARDLTAWAEAINRYATNASQASSALITGTASFDELRPSLDRMAKDLATAQELGDRFREAAYSGFQQTLSITRENNSTTIRFGMALSLVLVLLVAFGAWAVTRSIMNNVHGVIDSLTAIARGDGDLTRRVNVDSNDEIGAMIKLFNSFLDTLQRTIRQIVEAAGPLGGVSKELYRSPRARKRTPNPSSSTPI